MSSALDMDLDDIIKQDKTSSSSRRGGRDKRRSGRKGAKKSGGESTSMAIDNDASPRKTSRRGTARAGKNAGNNGRLGGLTPQAAAALLNAAAKLVPTRGSDNVATPSNDVTVQIKNLDPKASVEDVRTSFQKFGPITKCTLVYNHKGQATGRAEVTFARRRAAEQAVSAMHGVIADGRKLSAVIETPTGATSASSVVSPLAQAVASISGGSPSSSRRRVVPSNRRSGRRSGKSSGRDPTFQVTI
ncbi:hypothetical protein IWQ61_003450 [Dispira simplex]|nr:hypothetical protein IWQ61_003450 [Dispira simplex]